MRSRIISLIEARPFRPFVVTLESGERIVIRHPENVAYDPQSKESHYFVAIADGALHTVPWEKLTSVAQADTGQPLPSPSK